MQNGEPNIYTALATLRSGYVQGQWNRLQLFLAFNAIAIPIVIGTDQSAQVKSLLSVAGVLIHYAVLLGAIRANEWINYWDEKLTALEQLDEEIPTNIVRVQVFSDPNFGGKRSSKWSTRFSFIPLAILIVGFWLVSITYHIFLIFTQ